MADKYFYINSTNIAEMLDLVNDYDEDNPVAINDATVTAWVQTRDATPVVIAGSSIGLGVVDVNGNYKGIFSAGLPLTEKQKITVVVRAEYPDGNGGTAALEKHEDHVAVFMDFDGP